MELCSFITVLGCTQPDFLSKNEAVQILIDDLTNLKECSNEPFAQQVLMILFIYQASSSL